MKHFILTMTICFLFSSISLAQSRLVDELFAGEKIPDNFSQLIESTRKKLEARYGGAVDVQNEAFDGRSLDADFDSTKWPRRVISFTISPRGGVGAAFQPLFIGYAPTKGRLEIISLSPGKGYDFTLIDNYKPENKGKKMTVSANQDKMCMTCHQAKAPIFSRFPWNETEGTNKEEKFRVGASSRLRIKLTPTKDKDVFDLNTNPGEVGSDSNSVLGKFSFSNRSNPAQPFIFDANVRSSNQGAQVARMCNTLCEDKDIECKKQLLLFSSVDLSTLAFNQQQSQPASIKSIQEEIGKFHKKITPRWDRDGFAYPSSVLPDRTLGKGDGHTEWFLPMAGIPVQTALQTFYSEERAGVDLSNLGIGRKIMIPGFREGLKTPDGKTLSHPGDPQHPRPLVSHIAPLTEDDYATAANISRNIFLNRLSQRGLPYCFDMLKDQLETNLSFDQLRQIILNDPEIDKLFRQNQATGKRLVDTFNRRVRAATGTEATSCVTCQLQSSFGSFLGQSASIDLKELEAKISKMGSAETRRAEVVKKTQQYCDSCHSPSSGIPLPLKDAKKLAEYRTKAGVRLVDRIKKGEMPPKAIRPELERHDPNLNASLQELAIMLEAETKK